MPTLSERDLAHVWHPCTQMKDHEWLPMLEIERGEGVWLHDTAGGRYLDGISSWWVNLFGHCNPRIAEAIRAQLGRLEHVIFAGHTHEPAVQLAETILEMAPPGFSRVFFADNGSSAVEVALKMSFHYWRNRGQLRTRFVNLSNAYHGETLGALSVGDVPLYKETYQPLLLDAITVPAPDNYGLDGETPAQHARRQAQALRAVLEAQAEHIAAVIVEPLVQCAGGMRMYDAEYLRELRALCDEFKVHLIADEIAVGFGRSGTLFACEQGPIRPDFLCLSKGLTGGFLPLALVLCDEEVYDAFYAEYRELKAFLHSHSYTGNPLACAAANATLAIFREQPVIERNRVLAEAMAAAVAPLQGHPHVGDIRQTGMILALELVADRDTLTPYPWQERRGIAFYRHALTRGALLRPLGNVIYLMPPYVISEDEIAWLGEVICEGVDQVTLER